jgi:hypothetical protein
MFENRILRRLFGPKKEEVAEGWRILLDEELHNSYFSPNIIRVIKSRKMRWARHAACMYEKCYKIFIGKLEVITW